MTHSFLLCFNFSLLQTQTMIGESRHYNGLKHCVETILKEEGVKGLYKGSSHISFTLLQTNNDIITFD